MRLSTAAALGCWTLLSACSDPKSTVLPADLTKFDTIQPQIQKLSDEEKTLFAGYATRKVMKGTMFGAMAGETDAATIGQAIENQRAFIAASKKREAEQKALAERVKAERDAALKALREVVTVALVEKRLDIKNGMSGMELDRGLSVTFAYKNNGAKDLAGVKGTIIVKDLFGDTISRFGVSNDDTIKAGGTVTWTGFRSTRFAFGQNKDEKLAELPPEKYKIEWEPQTIVFSDGTNLSVPK